jgi:hypothetical protein
MAPSFKSLASIKPVLMKTQSNLFYLIGIYLIPPQTKQNKSTGEMKMKHAYYLSKDMDELEHVHDELIMFGLHDQNIHVLSDSEAEVQLHHMRPMNSFLKTNVVHALFYGALIGIAVAMIIISIPYFMKFETTIPFTLGAIAALGFATWEGGFIGIQKFNEKFKDIANRIHQGQHLLIVDYNDEEEKSIRALSRGHPSLRFLSISNSLG